MKQPFRPRNRMTPQNISPYNTTPHLLHAAGGFTSVIYCIPGRCPRRGRSVRASPRQSSQGKRTLSRTGRTAPDEARTVVTQTILRKMAGGCTVEEGRGECEGNTGRGGARTELVLRVACCEPLDH